MKKSKTTSNGNTVSFSLDKISKLSDYIKDFIVSNKFNVFKIIYIKDCNDSDWYENLSNHVGGVLINAYLKYNIKITTHVYSNEESRYIPTTYIFENVDGRNIVDVCFNNIKEASSCDMLSIETQASIYLNPFLSAPGQDPNYHGCYLFARK